MTKNGSILFFFSSPFSLFVVISVDVNQLLKPLYYGNKKYQIILDLFEFFPSSSICIAFSEEITKEKKKAHK